MGRVLLVDDDEGILEALQIAIESEDYEVLTTTKGEQSIDLAKKYYPNVVVMDLLLSGKNGSELTVELKSCGETRNIPVILISAHPGAEKTATDCGADEFLAKPFSLDDLLQRIAKYMPPNS